MLGHCWRTGFAPGARSHIEGDKEQKIPVRIVELKEPAGSQARESSRQGTDEGARLGLVVRSLTPEEKDSAGVDSGCWL